MPGFKAQVEHDLGKDEASRRLQSFVQRVRDKYQDQVKNLEAEWVENSLNFAFRTYGFNVSGVLAVTDDSAAIEGKIPFAAVAFKGKIQQSVRDELAKALAEPAPAEKGEGI